MQFRQPSTPYVAPVADRHRVGPAVGHALHARLLGRTFWTVSAWTGRRDLGRFARSGPHRAAKDATRPAMQPSTFVMWRCRADDLPISWQEVRARVEAATVPDEEDHPGPPPAAWPTKTPSQGPMLAR